MGIKADLKRSFLGDTFLPQQRSRSLFIVTMVHLHQPSFCPRTLLSSLKCLTSSHVHSLSHRLLSSAVQLKTSTNNEFRRNSS